MTERELGESNRQLREVAGELEVSDRQLRRWRDEGLLPKPIGRRGKGRAVGSETFYPVGTCDQLRAVVRWFKYKHRREVVRWALWCDGFDVRIDWTKFLLNTLSEARATARDQLSAYEEDEPGNPLQTLEGGPLPSGLRRFEKQGHHGDFVTFIMETTKTVAKGNPDLLPIDEGEIGLMISHALPKGLRHLLAQYGAASDVEEGRGLNESLKAFDYAALEEYVREDSSRLEPARDEALRIFRRVWPERAGIRPLPEWLFVLVLMSQRLRARAARDASTRQLGKVRTKDRASLADVVDWICNQPGGVQMMKEVLRLK